jgi:ketosteroid isomerase-like protein
VPDGEGIVREHFDAASRGDFAAAGDAFDDSVELVVHSSLQGGTYCGRGAVGKWFADWFRSFADGYRFEVDEIRGFAEHVFVVISHRGRGRASGVELDWSRPYAYTVRSGKIVRVEIFERRDEALEALGLEE